MEPTMDFGHALKLLKNGKKAARKEWLKSGYFAFISEFKNTVTDPFLRNTNTETSGLIKTIFVKTERGIVHFRSFVHDEDLLAEDWEEVV